MNFLNRVRPAYTPPGIQKQGSLAVLRDRILQSLLIGLSSLGLLALAVGIYMAYAENEGPALPIVYASVYLVISLFTLQRHWPYRLRASVVILIFYLISLTQLYDGSIIGEVVFWMLGAVIITALLLEFRTAMAVCIFCSLTVIGVSQFAQYNPAYFPDVAHMSLGGAVATNVLLLFFLGTTLSSSLTALVNGLNRLASEKESLVANLEEERRSLEDRVEERTEDLQRRLTQVRAAAEISNAIGRINDPDALFNQVVDLIQGRFNLYYVGLFLIDDIKQYAVLRAGTGEAGKTMLARGHRLQVGSGSMIGWCIANRRARIALDVGAEAVRFNNPLLPLTRSELALPILSRGEVVGALTVQSTLAEAFDQNDIIVLQGIADVLAAAIENSRLVTELQQNLDELSALNRNFVRRNWSQVIEETGNQTFSFQSAPGAETPQFPVEVPILLRDQRIANLTLDMDEPRLTADEMAFLDAITTQTALALENARLVQKTEQRVLQEQKLNEMSARFSRSSDIESILKAAAEELGRLPSVSEVSVELVTGVANQNIPGIKTNGNGHAAG